MPNKLDSNGLQTIQQSEIIASLTSSFQSIYGTNINLGANTPDGQMMYIFAQGIMDVAQLLMQIYNSFDPDKALGSSLDARVAINGIQRVAGTYTVTNVTITISTTGSVNLYGLDQTAQQVYTVQDNAGNQWQLQTTNTGLTTGSYVLAFQSATPGAILTTIGTITSAVTSVLGVTGINNPSTYTSLGTNEETDAALRVRRQKSVALASTGFVQSLLAALENVSGVSAAFVYENVTGTTDGSGVPGHSIWCIVGGSAAAADIANAIYLKRSAGCGMYGSQSYNVSQPNGVGFTVYWDNVTTQNLFIEATLSSIDGVNVPNYLGIVNASTGLPKTYAPGVYQEVDITSLGTAIQAIDPNALVTGAGFCTTYNGVYANTLQPSTKNKQFVVLAANIILTPVVLVAAGGALSVSGGEGSSTYVSTANIAHGGNTIQFSVWGGYGTMTYAMTSGAGSINSSTGLYTSSTAGTDVVHVTDGLGNTATCTITVS